ncbi:hypothetical protein M5689_017204 [Euphorbia peplus]|nr:hypothetical protein M5689_017204 [Euphorbia peplus]
MALDMAKNENSGGEREYNRREEMLIDDNKAENVEEKNKSIFIFLLSHLSLSTANSTPPSSLDFASATIPTPPRGRLTGSRLLKCGTL